MIFLIFFAFLSIWIIVGNLEREPNWRLALIQAGVIWASYLTVGTEVLSFFSAVTRVGLLSLWSLPVVGGILWVWSWLKRGKVLRLPIIYRYRSWVGTILDVLVLLILLTSLVVAVVAPPNSNGGLVYRMSRVAHWAQNKNLSHYPTGIEIQNSYSPGAEIIILNFYVLDGGDRLANLAAWLGFAGCVLAAASIARVLGADVNGQRMASIFSATLPVAIVQATSAMNDTLLSFWIVSSVLMLLLYSRESQKPIHLILASLSAALAILTKPTALIFLWPFALYLVVILLWREGFWRLLLWGAMAILILGVVNGGYFWRNQKTYQEFYRPVEWRLQNNDIRGWQVMVSNISRNAALHADLPFPRAETWLKQNIEKLHGYLGLSPSDPRTTLGGPFYIPQVNTSEMTSGNPVHAGIIVFSFTVVIGMVILGKEDPELLIFSSAILCSLLLYSYFLKWQPTGGRLHLPFFILFAPLIAFVLDKFEKIQLETAAAVLLLVYAMPWLLQTAQRPVIADVDRTYPISVFSESRDLLYFATNPEDYAPYKAIASEINRRDIHLVGLDLEPDSEEYPFWVFLGAPSDTLEIHWVGTETASGDYLLQDFEPEVIICEGCSPETLESYGDGYQVLPFDPFDLLIKD